MKILKDKFMGSVKVGPKGQVVIPIEGRKMFNIKSGDTLIILGDKKRGIALLKSDEFYKIAGFDK